MWSEVVPEPGEYWVKFIRTGEEFIADVEDDWVFAGDYMTSHSEYLYGPKVLKIESWTPVLNQIHEERAKLIVQEDFFEHAIFVLANEEYPDIKRRLTITAALLVAELERLDDTPAN